MRKKLFLSIVAAIAVAMTFVSCGKKTAENTEEPLAEGFTLVTTPQGAKGIKKGDAVLIEPKADYKDISFTSGWLIAKTENGQSLLDPENGSEKISGDTIVWKDTFFEAQRGDLYVVYIPACKAQFAGQAYAVKGAYAISLFNGKITAYQDGQPITEPTGEFAKMAILPDGKILVLKGKAWATATLKGKTLFPSKAVTPKDLKKFKKMKGWDEKSPVMILE